MLDLAIIMLKPDALKRGLAEHIVNLVTAAGLQIVSTVDMQLTEDLIRKFQPVMNEPSEFGEEWKQEVIKALTETPVTVMLIQGDGAIDKCGLIKKCVRKQYSPGNNYLSRVVYNLMHATDSEEETENHLQIFFPDYSSSTSLADVTNQKEA